ncbi:hypothetical protein H0O00_02615 [Candidatus Micrarchaeota archaeon]|nr:hypothetical protein [Candidatus Micrarchaeota archaeon]
MGLIEMWGSWVGFAGIALGISTVLVAIVYMLSEFLMNDRMKGWAKLELAEIFYSALIISMAITTLPLIDAVVQGALLGTGTTGTGTAGCAGGVTTTWIATTDYGHYTPSKTYECLDICGAPIAASPNSVYNGIESCHMRLGIWYMRELFDETKNLAFDTYLSYIWTSMWSEFTINIEFVFEKAGFFTFTPWKGFFTMGNKVKEMCFDWAMKLMMLLKFQEVTLSFIAKAVFPAFFVIGAILRTFTMTRRLGGLLLAIAIALYFVFPAFYAFGALVMLDIKNGVWQEWTDQDNPANPCNNILQANPDDCADPPIANVMYINATIPMPGGNGQGYTTWASREKLNYYEGMDAETYLKYIEEGKDSANDATIMNFDLSKNVQATDEEKKQKFEEVSSSMDAWKKSAESENKIDDFLSIAWTRNGPVDTLARLTFWAVFFSLFSIIGTIAAIRSLSITFGGDIEIAGLTRLI